MYKTNGIRHFNLCLHAKKTPSTRKGDRQTASSECAKRSLYIKLGHNDSSKVLLGSRLQFQILQKSSHIPSLKNLFSR